MFLLFRNPLKPGFSNVVQVKVAGLLNSTVEKVYLFFLLILNLQI